MANSMKHLPLPLTCPLHLLRLLLLLLLVLVLMLDSCRLVMVQGHGLGREIVVGEDQHWRFGLNYSAWADKTGPFFVGDTLGKCPMTHPQFVKTSLLHRIDHDVLRVFIF